MRLAVVGTRAATRPTAHSAHSSTAATTWMAVLVSDPARLAAAPTVTGSSSHATRATQSTFRSIRADWPTAPSTRHHGAPAHYGAVSARRGWRDAGPWFGGRGHGSGEPAPHRWQRCRGLRARAPPGPAGRPVAAPSLAGRADPGPRPRRRAGHRHRRGRRRLCRRRPPRPAGRGGARPRPRRVRRPARVPRRGRRPAGPDQVAGGGAGHHGPGPGPPRARRRRWRSTWPCGPSASTCGPSGSGWPTHCRAARRSW